MVPSSQTKTWQNFTIITMSTINMYNLNQSIFVKHASHPTCAKQCPISLTEKPMDLVLSLKNSRPRLHLFSLTHFKAGRQAFFLFWITFKSKTLIFGWSIRPFNLPSILIRKEMIMKAKKAWVWLYAMLQMKK